MPTQDFYQSSKSVRREYNYGDVFLLSRKKAMVGSRSECDTSVRFGKRTFNMPVCPANMASVVNEETCKFLASRGWFYVMHRFGTDPVKFIVEMHSSGYIASISIGVNAESYKQIDDIVAANLKPDYITLDIASAWSPKAEKMIKYVKDRLPESFLIVGNMAVGEAVQEIEKWGADCCKLFIGPGLACTTKLKTGFTRPTISCLQECVQAAAKPVIADGGVREHGDIAKAIACGATMVMAGSLFCGYNESAGEIIEIDGHKKSVYFGSASEHNKGKYTHVEGKKLFLDYKGDMNNLLVELQEDLRSSISYAGGNDLSALLGCELIAIN
jgi:GMP reductase